MSVRTVIRCVLLAGVLGGCYQTHRGEERAPDVGGAGIDMPRAPRPMRDLTPVEDDYICDGVRRSTSAVIDTLDMLFVVDNSRSMIEEQRALAEQFPRMVRTLVTGERRNDDGSVEAFTPVSSLHLGVVTTDLGLPDIDGVQGCKDLGGDGRLRPCRGQGPVFLEYGTGDSVERFAEDFRCMAQVGNYGCGFEQPLEAALKALWPAVDRPADSEARWFDGLVGRHDNRITFVGDSQGQGIYGHGDGENAGFLRNAPGTVPAALAIVVVTDEEDCSAADLHHFIPDRFLQDGDPVKGQPTNLRCFLNKQNLYALDRYVNGFRALHPGNEDLVLFAAIAGIPTDLVQLYDDDGEVLVDLQDAAQREAFYAAILDDPRMQERPADLGPEDDIETVKPSCGGDDDDSSALAYPPRRIVELARAFGAGGVVQSICQTDFTYAIDAILRRAVVRLGPLECGAQ